MIWKNALKYPALIMGVIMFVIFVSDPKTKIWWNKISRRYIPSTCDSIVERISAKADKSWEMDCPGTKKLVISIPLETEDSEPLQMIRVKMYRLAANSISSLAQMADPNSMEHILELELFIRHNKLDLFAKTDGEAIVQIRKKINEYDTKKLIQEAQGMALQSGEKDQAKLDQLTEKFAIELRDKKIDENLKKVPELLKLVVKTREIPKN